MIDELEAELEEMAFGESVLRALVKERESEIAQLKNDYEKLEDDYNNLLSSLHEFDENELREETARD